MSYQRPMPKPRNYTPCYVKPAGKTCHEPSHVVLFAVGGEFAGRTYLPGQHILTCLSHADDILTARRVFDGRRDVVKDGPAAGWLHYDIARGGLPLPTLSAHRDTTTQAWEPPHRKRRADKERPSNGQRVPYVRA